MGQSVWQECTNRWAIPVETTSSLCKLLKKVVVEPRRFGPSKYTYECLARIGLGQQMGMASEDIHQCICRFVVIWLAKNGLKDFSLLTEILPILLHHEIWGY